MKRLLELNIKRDKDIEYRIEITDENFSNFVNELVELNKEKKFIIVISKKVFDLYHEELELEKFNYIIIKDGEKEKNIKNYIKIINFAIKNHISRNDLFVAIGGGVIGDLTGFAASTYMRGVEYIQVPTTLLSMVDSSVGGKNGINFDNVKNIAGTFKQPKKVYININFLNTLDDKQYKSGLGEILKYSFIEDSCPHKTSEYLFEYLMINYENVAKKIGKTLFKIIETCLKLKIGVVQEDEKENSLRKILNLGHTVAHALETETKYKKYTHGQAVIYGIYVVFDWAYKNNYISYSYYRLAMELMEKYGFKETSISKKFDTAELVKIMQSDKKSDGENITFIIPTDKKKVQEIQLTQDEVLNMLQ